MTDKKIDELIAKSSIGAALADIKARGIDAHLIDLEHEMHPRRRAKKPATVNSKPVSRKPPPIAVEKPDDACADWPDCDASCLGKEV